jgi:hAT family C-terminal dimerisation region
MAFDILSIRSMSAGLERTFSQAKKLITDERNRLGEEMVQACECQKQWLTEGKA